MAYERWSIPNGMPMAAKLKHRISTVIGTGAGLLILVLTVFFVIRSLSILNGELNPDEFEIRYLNHPVVSALHMLFGIAFVALAPLQFSTKFRARNPKIHRWLGRFLLLAVVITAIYGIVAAAVMPVFGGLAGTTASWVFGSLFIVCAAFGFWNARRKRFAQHREWMIRTFAIGLAVGTQRIVLALLAFFGGYGFYESFGVALWIGFTFNMIVAETWINLSRK